MAGLMRVEGWETALARYIESSRATPFAWGTHDCALWAAGWVKLCTGRDFTREWAGRYDTEFGALRLMAERGHRGVEDIAGRNLPERPVRSALRGDLMLHPSGALGVNFGAKSFFVTEAGLIAERSLACARAWEVS